MTHRQTGRVSICDDFFIVLLFSFLLHCFLFRYGSDNTSTVNRSALNVNINTVYEIGLSIISAPLQRNVRTSPAQFFESLHYYKVEYGVWDMYYTSPQIGSLGIHCFPRQAMVEKRLR